MGERAQPPFVAMADDSPEKRPRVEGTMPAPMRAKIENALDALDDVEFNRRSHHSRGPLAARILPDEDLVHEKGEIVRQGGADRIHYVCSNDKCPGPIRSEKWNDHVLKMTSDVHLREPAEDVLERSMNFVADGQWCTRERRMKRVLTFMEQRHYLALARMHGEVSLAKRITDDNRFLLRLTNMVRTSDPTSRTLINHCAANYAKEGDLGNLIVNIMFLRNTMSRQTVKLCEKGGRMPWIRVERGRVVEESKQALGEVYMKLGGAVFFLSVEPMKSRGKSPRRGWGELVSELVTFALRSMELAAVWRRANRVENFSREVRKISGFGGKGFRMKDLS